MFPEVPQTSRSSEREEIALTSYLNAILAIAKCMGEVCPQEGLIFSDRLRRLPRRLAFDATPRAIEESREALEADLAEYAQATSAWVDAGAKLAREILVELAAIQQDGGETPAPHAAMIADLADQMEVSAEVDAESDVRAGLRRYAASLRSYAQGRNNGQQPLSPGLERRAGQLAEWLARANPANSIDAVTGLLNRQEIEKQLQGYLNTSRLFSVLVFEWEETDSTALVKQVADSLVALVRPRDIVGRWGTNQLAVIFECSAREAMARAAKISEWLSGSYSLVQDGTTSKIKAQVPVTVVERLPQDTLADLVGRLDSARLTKPGGGNSREPVPA
jgi:GGDEF domain-containing protein